MLIPLTHQPGGAVDKPVNDIATRLNAKPEQVLLSWAKSKGVVVVTSSTKKERLEGYLDAGDLGELLNARLFSMWLISRRPDLTDDDITSIDEAGAKSMRQQTVRNFVRRAAVVALVGAVGFGVCGLLGIDIL